MVVHTLTRNWWIFAIRGIAAIIFGILAFLVPAITLGALILLFGAYAIVDGVSLIYGVARHGTAYMRHHWTLLLIGVLSLGAGVIAFVLPGLTALSLLYVVAAWSVVIGIVQIAAAINLRREIAGELWMALGGILAIVFGVYLVVFPGDGLLTLVWLVGAWAIIFGLFSLLLSVRLRGIHEGALSPSR